MTSGTILVTGASGFVGADLVQTLRRHGRPVRAAMRAALPGAGPDVVAIGDIAGPVDWPAHLTDVECVIHCAARAHVLKEEAADPLAAFRAVNRDATLALARAAAAAGVRRFIFLSSIGVNGGETTGRPFRGDDPPNPHSPYAVAKHEAEIGLREIAASSALELVIIRPPLVIGPAPKGHLGTLLGAIRRGVPLPLGQVRSNRRDLVSLDTLVDLVITCIDHPAAPGQSLLISDGAPLSTRQIAQRLAADAGLTARFLPVPLVLLRTGLAAVRRRAWTSQLLGNLEVDIGSTCSRLGWTPPPRTPSS